MNGDYDQLTETCHDPWIDFLGADADTDADLVCVLTRRVGRLRWPVRGARRGGAGIRALPASGVAGVRTASLVRNGSCRSRSQLRMEAA